MEKSQATMLILDSLDEAYNRGKTWYGPNLRPTLVSLDPASRRYTGTFEGYSAWVIALHCAYWKWFVRRGLTGEDDPFPYSPDDFPEVPTKADEATWKHDLAYLDEQQRKLKEVTAKLDSRRLDALWVNSAGEAQEGSNARMVMGIAFHDAYHAAQIRNMGIPALGETRR